jgi:hydrogenase-4 membrane subunit HyfE
MSGLLDESAIVMSYLLIIVALLISATRTLKIMVRLYQAQGLVLTIVVLLTAFEPNSDQVALGVVAVLPLTLAVIVPPLLARATVEGPVGRSRPSHSGFLGLSRLRSAQQRVLSGTELIWLQNGQSRLPVTLSATIDSFLIALAVLVSYRLAALHVPTATSRIAVVSSLAVSIALLLQGLFTMINKNDIVSQIIGLLVVDQGLFLAAVRVAPPDLADLFVLSLFLYVLITLTILLWVLPGLHRASNSIKVTDNADLKE